MYFTQLLGLALGSPPKKLGVGTEFVSTSSVLSYVKQPD
jgi:heterodisulfide reductase subunit B